MSLYIVRHASAGHRYAWDGPDELRPLDDRGRAQADNLSRFLVDRDVTRLLSSDAVRCTQSLGPLAHRTGLVIDEAAELVEGAPGEAAAGLARSLATTTAVLCSHGDVIPAMIRSLALDGMVISGDRGCEKGSIWALETLGGDIVSGTYLGRPPRHRPEQIDS